jgi:hypothetical protein
VSVDLAEFPENEKQQNGDHEQQELKRHKTHRKTTLELVLSE